MQSDPLKLFIRQGFTESGEKEQAIIKGMLQQVQDLSQEMYIAPLTDMNAHNANTFKHRFTEKTGLPFSPAAFRDYRLNKLDKADAFLIIRTGLSESTSFEIAHNVNNKNVPMFFAVWENAQIKTTLLRDLPNAKYHTFSHPDELKDHLYDFFAFAQKFKKRGILSCDAMNGS